MSGVRTLSLKAYHEAAEFQRIGDRAVRKAQEESRRKSIPNVYSYNGTLYYELPDGGLTTVDPFETRDSK